MLWMVVPAGIPVPVTFSPVIRPVALGIAVSKLDGLTPVIVADPLVRVPVKLTANGVPLGPNQGGGAVPAVCTSHSPSLLLVIGSNRAGSEVPVPLKSAATETMVTVKVELGRDSIASEVGGFDVKSDRAVGQYERQLDCEIAIGAGDRLGVDRRTALLKQIDCRANVRVSLGVLFRADELRRPIGGDVVSLDACVATG